MFCHVLCIWHFQMRVRRHVALSKKRQRPPRVGGLGAPAASARPCPVRPQKISIGPLRLLPTAHTWKPIACSFGMSIMLRPSKMKAGFDIELKMRW